jgi:hypothetical protein
VGGWAEVIDNAFHVNCSRGGLFNILVFGDRTDEGAKAEELPVEYEERGTKETTE